MRKDASISTFKARFFGVLLGLPLLLLFSLPFLWLWGWERTIRAWLYFVEKPGEFLLIMAAGVLAHELLHGFLWALAGRQPLERIQFGMDWNTLTPFARCKVPIRIGAYRLGSLVPGLVLGVIPLLVGTAAGIGAVMVIGLLFTLSAYGDFLALWLLRGVRADAWVVDHPNRTGCLVIE